MKYLFLFLIPVCSSSYVSFKLGDSSYSYGDKKNFIQSATEYTQGQVEYTATESTTASASLDTHLSVTSSPVYKRSRYNCSVAEEITTTEVCTTSFQTTCVIEERRAKRVVDKEQCISVTLTVCSESEEEIENEVCTYTYEKRSQETTATIYKVVLEKICQTQNMSVCKPSGVLGAQYCEDVEQEFCQDVPKVMPIQTTVIVSYPQPVMSCAQKPINIPVITCKKITEEKCIIVPEILEDLVMVKKCEVSLGSPFCKEIQLTLPWQVCKEGQYGQTYGKKYQMNVTEFKQQKNKIDPEQTSNQQNFKVDSEYTSSQQNDMIDPERELDTIFYPFYGKKQGANSEFIQQKVNQDQEQTSFQPNFKEDSKQTSYQLDKIEHPGEKSNTQNNKEDQEQTSYQQNDKEDPEKTSKKLNYKNISDHTSNQQTYMGDPEEASYQKYRYELDQEADQKQLFSDMKKRIKALRLIHSINHQLSLFLRKKYDTLNQTS